MSRMFIHTFCVLAIYETVVHQHIYSVAKNMKKPDRIKGEEA